MKTVKIVEPFDGYPNGQRRTFAKGDVVEVADDFADLVVGKGHAKEQEAEPAAAKKEKRP